MDRVIGTYQGTEPGPMLIAFGAMHGNEPAGVKALDLALKMLEVESIRNPEFSFKGRFIAMLGNKLAYEKKRRFMEKDLNRSWTKKLVEESLTKPEEELTCEQQEIKEILLRIKKEITEHQPEQIIVLDLHTTSSKGGIFTLATDEELSTKIASKLHAPVVKGMLEGIRGTSINYFNTENIGVPTTTIVFESGQHNDPKSINRAVSAIINCMRTIGCVQPDDVENIHDATLKAFSDGLPKVSHLIAKHHISPEDEFRMLPNFKSFDPVQKNQHIANDKNGPILSPADGRILMPLYQKQGEDGFFIIKEE